MVKMIYFWYNAAQMIYEPHTVGCVHAIKILQFNTEMEGKQEFQAGTWIFSLG